MPFYDSPQCLEHFMPDRNFDPANDLVQVNFPGQKMYVSFIRNTWIIPIDDLTMSRSMRQAYEDFPYPTPNIIGIQVDKSNIGRTALFGLLGHGWHNQWRSDEPVLGFDQMKRAARLRSSVTLRSYH